MRALTIQALALAAGLLPAMAHVHAEGPARVQPGQRVEVVLAFAHGCGADATTGLAVALPAQIGDVTPEDVPGWTAVIEDGVLRWQGGIVPADQPARFVLHARLADDAQGQILLPTIQTCGGHELRWIDADPASPTPAPRIEVARP